MEQNKWKNKDFFQALHHSLDGIKLALKNERNLKTQLKCGIFVIIIAFLLKVNYYEWMILVITIGLVLFAEMVNTAIEVLLDIYSEEYNEKIKNAKDVASGAVLIVAVVSAIVGIIIFLPKIINIFNI